MKITFFVYNIYGMGGTVRTVVNTANYLAEKGHKVEIISVKITSQKPLFNIHPKIILTPIVDSRRGRTFRKDIALWKRILMRILFLFPSRKIDKTEDLYKMFNLFTDIIVTRRFKEIDEGVIITTIPSFNLMATKYAKKKIIKIGQEHKDFSAHSPSLQKKIKKHYHKLDALTCLTIAEENRYKNMLGDSVKVLRVENATSIPNYRSDFKNKTIISAGRYSPEKAFDILIKAFAKIKPEFPDWKLKIFGTGPEKENLSNIICEEKLHNNVFLLPTSNSLQNEMKNSSLYAMSSRSESFGMVLIEAMAVGIPCVSFACIGPSEVIKHGEDGLLVEEGNIEELASSIRFMISSKERLIEYGDNARDNVERYSITNIGKKWDNLLNEIS